MSVAIFAMWPFILAYILILVVWAVMSFIAIQQVYAYAYKSDGLSRNLTILYVVISIMLAFNGLRILFTIHFDQLFS